MTVILIHLGEEQGDSPQSETESKGPSDPILLLEIQKVQMQALQMKLEYEREEKERKRKEK